MADWKSAEEALSDPKFHDQDLDTKRGYLADLGGFGNVDAIDDLLSRAYNKYAVPQEQRFTKQVTELTPNAMGKITKTLPAPEDPAELIKDPAFHKQPIENKKAQLRMAMPEFGRLPDEEQITVLNKAWNKYYKPTHKPPVKELPAPPIQDWTQVGMEAKQAADKESLKYLGDLGNQVWQGAKEGIKGIGEAAGGGLQVLGHLVDSDTLEKWGQDANNWLEKEIPVEETPEDMAGSIIDKPYLLADPRWWARSVGTMIPNVALFAAAGAGAGAIATKVLGAAATATKTAVVSSLINSVFNGAYVGASQYVQEKKSGATDDQAAKAAAAASAGTIGWTFIAGLPLFAKPMRSAIANVIKDVGVGAGMMTGQTAIQNISSNTFTDAQKPIWTGMPEAAIMGGFVGPAVSHGFEAMRPTPESVATLQKQVKGVLDGDRPFVLFQHTENTPGFIKGLERFDYKFQGTDNEGKPIDIDSTFFFDPKRTSAEEIKNALNDKNMKRLGYIDQKGPDTTHEVAVVDRDGTELSRKAVRPENIEAQKEIERQQWPADKHPGSVIVDGKIEQIGEILDSLRTNDHVDNKSEVAEKINSIVDKTEAAPEGVNIEVNEPKRPATEKSPEESAKEQQVVPSENKPEGEIVPEEQLPERPVAKIPEEAADSNPERFHNPPSIEVTEEKTFSPPPTPEGMHESLAPFPNPVVEKPAEEISAKKTKSVKYKKKETKAEFRARLAGDLDKIRQGHKITTDDGTEYVRGAGGWQKIAKNGNPSGAPTKSKTFISGKIKMSPERLADLVSLGLRHAEEDKAATTEKLMSPPPPIEESMPYVDVYGKEGNLVNIDMKPGGKAKGVAKELTKAQTETTANPLDLAMAVEAGDVPMVEPLPAGTPLERAEDGTDYSSLVTTSQDVATPETATKKVKVWAKKVKNKLPEPTVDQVALQETPKAPEDIMPVAKSKERPPISRPEYEQSRKNLVDVKEKLSEVESDIKARENRDTSSALSRDATSDLNMDDLTAKSDRLKKTQAKLERDITEYESTQDMQNPPETPQLVYPESEPEANQAIKESFESKPPKLSKEELDKIGNEYMSAKSDEEREAIVKKLLKEADDSMSSEDGVGELIVHLEDQAITTEEFSHVQDTLDDLLGPVHSTEEISNSVDNQLRAADIDPNDPVQAFTLPIKMRAEDNGRNIRVRDSVDGKMLGIRGIVVRLAKALDVPLRFKLQAPGKMNKKGVGGYFMTKIESIHINSRAIAEHGTATELDVVPHEVGHYLDLVWLRDGKAANVNGVPSFGTQYDTEVNKIASDYFIRAGIDPTTVDPSTLRNEGIAEFFRRFVGMTDPKIDSTTVDGKTVLHTASRESLQQEAPGFYDMVTKTLDKYPDILNIVNRATQDIHDYLSSDLITQAKADIYYSSDMKDLVHNTIPEKIGNFLFNMRRLWENRLLPQERDVKQMMKLDPSQKDDLTHIINMIENERGKVEEQTKYSMENAWIDNNGKVDPEIGSLVSILKGVDDLRALDVYLRAVNAREIEKPRLIPGTKKLAKTRNSGMPKAQQDAAINAYGGKYYEVAKKLTAWSNRNLKLLVEEGRITEEKYERITNARQMYAPMWRVAELMGKNTSGGRPSPQGFVNLPAGPMYTKGGEAPVHSPLESMLKNAINIRGISRKTKYFEQFSRAAEAVQGHGRIIEAQTGDTKITRISHNDVIAKLQSVGVKTEELLKQAKESLKLPDDQDVDLSIIMYDTIHNSNPQDQTVLHHRDGEPVMFKIGHTDTYNSLTGQDAKLWGFNSTMAAKILQYQTKMLRAGSILHPNFSMRNFLKDPISAWVYSHYGYNPADQGKIIAEAITNNKHYGDDFHAHGGGMGDMMAQDMNSLQKTIDDILGGNKSLKDKYADKWARAVTPGDKARFAWEITGEAGLQKIQGFSHTLEEMTRIGLYNKTIDVLTSGKPETATPEQVEIAIREAKDTTLPYHISGTAGAELNRLDAFFNANIQDISKFMREHTWEHIKITYNKDLKLGQNLRENFHRNTIMKGLAYHLPLAALTFLLGKDDEKIQNLPAWRKASAWNFNVGKLTGNKDWILSIPKSFLLGQVYGSSVEGVLNWLHRRDESASSAAVKWATGMWNAAAPSLMLNGPLPLIENWVNYHSFTNSQLESQALQELDPAYRTTPSTSALAQTLAHGTAWTGKFADSPVKIDNLIRGWFGAFGRTGADVLGYGLSALNSQSVPTTTKTLREYPVVSALSISPYTPSDFVRRFYDATEIVSERMKTFSSFNRTQDLTEQKKYYDENRKLINWYSGDPSVRGSGAMSAIAKAKKDLSDISKEMAIVQKTKYLTSDEKQTRLLSLSARRDKIAEFNFKHLFHKEDKETVY